MFPPSSPRLFGSHLHGLVVPDEAGEDRGEFTVEVQKAFGEGRLRGYIEIGLWRTRSKGGGRASVLVSLI